MHFLSVLWALGSVLDPLKKTDGNKGFSETDTNQQSLAGKFHHIISQPNVDWNIPFTLLQGGQWHHQQTSHFKLRDNTRTQWWWHVGKNNYQQCFISENPIFFRHLPPPCSERKWKSYAVLCFPSAQIFLVRILEMQSNVSSSQWGAKQKKNKFFHF